MRNWSVAWFVVSAVICSLFFCSTIYSSSAENLLRKLRMKEDRDVQMLPQKQEDGKTQQEYEYSKSPDFTKQRKSVARTQQSRGIPDHKSNVDPLDAESEKQTKSIEKPLPTLERPTRELLHDTYESKAGTVAEEIAANIGNTELEKKSLLGNTDIRRKKMKLSKSDDDTKNQHNSFRTRGLKSIDSPERVEDDPGLRLNPRMLSSEYPYNSRKLMGNVDDMEDDPTTTPVEYIDDPHWKPPIPFDSFSNEEIRWVDHLPDIECERDESGRCTSDDETERDRLDAIRRKRYLEVASRIAQIKARDVEYDEELETTTASIYEDEELAKHLRRKHESL